MPAPRFLTAQWRHLLMLNCEVDRAALAPLVPAGTELDSFGDRTWASLVAFRFRETRLMGVPVPGHRDFEELNLRFYVRRVVGDEWRRGVVFVKEVVPRRVIAAVARAFYNEPYVALPMRSAISGVPPSVEYGWLLRDRWHSIGARAEGPGAVPAPDSVEAFITEHYWGYTRQRDGGTIEYRVEHPRWHVWPAADLRMDADLAALYGPRLAGMLGQPVSTFVADGSAVAVSWPRRIA